MRSFTGFFLKIATSDSLQRWPYGKGDPLRQKKVGFNWPEPKIYWPGPTDLHLKTPYNNDTNYFSESKFTLRMDMFEVSVSIRYRGLPDRLSFMYR